MYSDEHARRAAFQRARCKESIRISNEMIRASEEWLAIYHSGKGQPMRQEWAFVESPKPWSLLRFSLSAAANSLSDLMTHLRIANIAVVASAQVGHDLMIVVEQRHVEAALEKLKRIGLLAQERLQQTGS